MRLIGAFLTACVVLAAAQALLSVLVVLLLIGFIVSLFTAPKETMGVVMLALLAGAFQSHPLALIGLIAFLSIIAFCRS